MSQTEPTRQSDDIWPPILGSIVNLPLTTTVLVIDLTSWAQSLALPNTKPKGAEHSSPLAQYLTFICNATFNLAFAATGAALASLSATATSTVPQSAGATQFLIPSGGTANGSVPWPAGVPLHVRVPSGPAADATSGNYIKWGTQSQARFLGLILPSGTATLSGWVSSG